MSKLKLTKLSQERIVYGIIFDSEMFYQPTKRKLKMFTSTGTKIIYPRSTVGGGGVAADDLKIIKKNKSFLHSKSQQSNASGGGEREKLWRFHQKLKLIIQSHYSDLKKSCTDLIFAEKFSYFEPNWTDRHRNVRSNVVESKFRHKIVFKSNSFSFYPSNMFVENIRRSISVKNLVSSCF